MTDLKITLTGPYPYPETHQFPIPPVPFAGVRRGRWIEKWSPGTALPDCWVALRRDGEVIEGERELSNAAVTVGQPARGNTNVDSILMEAPGYTVVVSRPEPTSSFLFPTKRTYCIRFALYPTGNRAAYEKAVALTKGKLQPSWSKDRKAFGPANMPLPDLSQSVASAFQGSYSQRRDYLWTAIANGIPFSNEDTEDGLCPKSVGGNPNFGSGKIGPFYPWGPISRDAPAGSGIQFSTGFQQSESFAQFALLAHQCCMDRAWVAYRESDGRPLSVDDYPGVSPNYAPGSGDPNNHELPEFRSVSGPDPLPLPYDFAHSIRGFRYAIAAWEMTGSPMVARHIRALAEDARLAYSERGPGPAYGYWPSNLRTHLSILRSSTPNQGFLGTIFGRQLGWPAWIAAEARKTGLKSLGWDEWFSGMVEAATLAAMPSGICQRVRHPDPAPGSDVWYDPDHDLAQAFEASIYWHGIAALCEQMSLSIPDAMKACAKNLYYSPFDLPPLPYGGQYGPYHFLFVAPRNGGPYLNLTSGRGSDPLSPGDPAHAEAFIALAVDKFGLPLSPATSYGYQAPSLHQKRVALENSMNLQWTANLLAMMQEMDV